MDFADDFAGAERDLEFAFEVGGRFFDEERQAVVFLGEVAQQYAHGVGLRLLHIIDEKLAEVAAHNPARVLGGRQPVGVAFGLEKRRE